MHSITTHRYQHQHLWAAGLQGLAVTTMPVARYNGASRAGNVLLWPGHYRWSVAGDDEPDQYSFRTRKPLSDRSALFALQEPGKRHNLVRQRLFNVSGEFRDDDDARLDNHHVHDHGSQLAICRVLLYHVSRHCQFLAHQHVCCVDCERICQDRE